MEEVLQYRQHVLNWTISLALIRDGLPSFVVIYDPVQNEVFWAEKGKGAFLNGTAVNISDQKDFWMLLFTFA